MKDLLFFSLIITRHWNKNIIKKYSSLFFFLFEWHQKVLYLFSFISMIDVRATRNQFNSIGSKPFLQFQKRAVTTCQRQGTVAQMVEPATQNQKVLGSIPAWIQWDFASKYAVYFHCIIFALKVCTNMRKVKKQILTSGWSVQHPNARGNIQHNQSKPQVTHLYWTGPSVCIHISECTLSHIAFNLFS